MAGFHNYTDWYPATQKPVREGAFQVDGPYDQSEIAAYCWWDNTAKLWGIGSGTPDGAKEVKQYAGRQNRSWRGIRDHRDE